MRQPRGGRTALDDRRLPEARLARQARRARLARPGRQRTAARATITIHPPDLLAVVSHELRTPITSLYGAAQLLDGRAMGQATQRELLLQVADGSARLMRFLDDLLGLAEASAGGLNPEPVAVRRIVERAVAGVRAGQVTARIIVDGAIAVDPAMADPDALRHALANLIGHAARTTPRGDAVRVTITAAPGRVVTTIRERAGRPTRRPWRTQDEDAAVAPGGRLWQVSAEALVRGMGGRLSITRRGASRTISVSLPSVHPDA